MALKHRCVSLAENLFNSAILSISKIKELENGYVQSSTVLEYLTRVSNVLDIIRNMLGFLLVLPEDP